MALTSGENGCRGFCGRELTQVAKNYLSSRSRWSDLNGRQRAESCRDLEKAAQFIRAGNEQSGGAKYQVKWIQKIIYLQELSRHYEYGMIFYQLTASWNLIFILYFFIAFNAFYKLNINN